MSTMFSSAAVRMPAPERRELILNSASEVFGERGYAGATTDLIAKAAGISQSYVVRTFGSKEKLFLEVLNRALRKMLNTFRTVVGQHRAEGLPKEILPRLMGEAYVDLINEHGMLLSLMQGFTQGHDPVIGKAARFGFMEVYALLRGEAGMTPEEARDFLAGGMLLNTLLGVQLPQSYGSDPAVTELLDVACGSKLGTVLASVGPDVAV